MSDTTPITTQRFDGTKWFLWRSQQIDKLTALRLNKWLWTEANEGKACELAEQKKALELVKSSLNPILSVKYNSHKTLKSLWNQLLDDYGTDQIKELELVKSSLKPILSVKDSHKTLKSQSNQLLDDYGTADIKSLFFKRNQFIHSKKMKDEPMISYLKRLRMMKQELAAAGLNVGDLEFILTIINGTHDEFGEFVWSHCGKLEDMKVDDLSARLVEEYDVRRERISKQVGIDACNELTRRYKLCFKESDSESDEN